MHDEPFDCNIMLLASGNKYIFTATCDLTKFLVAVPTVDCTAVTAANCLLEHILCRYNFPSRLISDNATSFTSQVIKELTKLFAMKKIYSTIYWPSSNKIERNHRTLNAFLRAFTEKNKDNWDEILKYATFVYNNTVHTTTGYTPHELAHGFKIQIPNQLNKTKLSYNYDNLADYTRNTIAKTLELARDHLNAKKQQNKQYYDSNARKCDIQVNNLVLIKSQVKKHKFQDVYEGPYRVVDTAESYITVMKKGKKLKIQKNHTKKAQADHENEPPQTTTVVESLDSEEETNRFIQIFHSMNFVIIKEDAVC